MITKPILLDETGQKILSAIQRIKNKLMGTTTDPITPGTAGDSGVKAIMQDDTGRDVISALNDVCDKIPRITDDGTNIDIGGAASVKSSGSNKGVAFGKVAETDNLVDSQWDIQTAGQLISGTGGVVVQSNGSYPTIQFKKTNENAVAIEAYGYEATNYNQFFIGEHHRANNVNSSYYDYYSLPQSGSDNATHGYQILTTKSQSALFTGTVASTGSWSITNGTGTFAEYPQIMTNAAGTMLHISGRLRINNFVRTGPNPSISVATSLRPSTGFSSVCGMRFNGSTAMPEGMVLTLLIDGSLSIMTNETITNIDNGVWYALFFGETFFLP